MVLCRRRIYVPRYCPYYVAFYGELVEGTKVRYLPIAADKNEITRTF